jgi:hypothetical protein
VAGRLDQAPQKVYYHVKRMEQAGLVNRVGERQVRGITEGIYQASGASYWLAPALVGAIGERRAQDEMSLGFLLSLAEELQSDLARLAATAGERPSLGLSGEVRTYTLRVPIGAPPESVYSALTDPGALEAWLAEHAEVSLKEGRYGFWGRYTPEGEPGRQWLLEFEPGRAWAAGTTSAGITARSGSWNSSRTRPWPTPGGIPGRTSTGQTPRWSAGNSTARRGIRT